MTHYVIVTAGAVTETLTTAFDPNLGREPPADWIETADERVAMGWSTTDGGVTFAAPVAIASVPKPREATGYALISALTGDQVAALSGAKVKDQRLLSARVTPWPEDNPKIARIAVVIKATPAAWFDAALNPQAA